MPRAATGRIESQTWKDGTTVTWRLRVRDRGQRHVVTLGTNVEGWNEQRAEVERDEIAEQIARGTWRPALTPKSAPAHVNSTETIHATLSRWWKDKRAEVSDGTAADYEWRLALLLGFDPHQTTADIDAKWVGELRASLAKRANKNGSGTLSPRSVNMALGVLAAALDLAVDDGLLGANPARGQRRKLKQAKPPRTSLEPDMVLAMLDAAGEWEAALPERQHYGRRALLALLCLSGPRISEAIAADRGDFDLKDGRWNIPASKTDAGKREVELSDFLVAELRTHAATMKTLGRPAGPRAPMFPTATGGRLNPSNLRNRLLPRVIDKADKGRGDSRRIPDGITPHSLRRTYASLALAAGDDPRFVMGQLGHTDARFTLSVYAQILQRKRTDKALIQSLVGFGNDTPSDPLAKSSKKTGAKSKRRSKKKPRR
jgi:integrase